jgi:hypothetical protein
MAVHNFNYTYTYVGVTTIPLSQTDSTQIVKNICVQVTAIDQDDSTQTATEKMYAPLSGIYSYRHDGLPETFIQVTDLTEIKVIEWFKNHASVENLDVHFTREIYGWQELDPPPEEPDPS